MNDRSCRCKRICAKKEIASIYRRGDYDCRDAIRKTYVPFVIASLQKMRNDFRREFLYV